MRKLAPLLVTSLVLAVPAAAQAADTTAPVLAVPQNKHYQLKDPLASVRMHYSVGVQDDTDAHPKTSCSPRSGSRFPVGTTKVTCTATDKAGNKASASFTITVSTKPRTNARKAKQSQRVSVRAYRQNAAGTWLIGTKVKSVAKGTRVKVACDRRCPAVLRSPVTLTSRGGSVNLAALLEYSAFKAGTTITVSVAGDRAGRIVIRAAKAPLVLS
jgi:hypothetical protein